MDTPFVTTDWLAERLQDPHVVIVDASWYLPTAGRNAREEHLAGHIPGAVFFDIDEVADKSTGLPHMLLPPDRFAEAVGALGIGSGMVIVVYDESGLFSAPRVWWEFLVMGAPDVRILEGGGPKWRAETRPLEQGASVRNPAPFTPHFHPELVRDFEQVASSLGANQTVVDARPSGRFAGRDAEPRPGLASGHMPGALNVPSGELTRNGQLKSTDELKSLFDRSGVNLDEPIITSCGSGVTAALLMLALRVSGARRVAVYDGSWADWGSRKDAQIVTD